MLRAYDPMSAFTARLGVTCAAAPSCSRVARTSQSVRSSDARPSSGPRANKFGKVGAVRPLTKPRDATRVQVMEDPVAAAAAAGAAIDAANAVFTEEKAGAVVEAAAEAFDAVSASASGAASSVTEAGAVISEAVVSALGGAEAVEAVTAVGEAAATTIASIDATTTAAVAGAAAAGVADEAAITAAGVVAGKAVAATGAALVVKNVATASIAKDMWATYSGLLSVYPLATKSITGSFLYSLSDGIAQKATMGKSVDEGDGDVATNASNSVSMDDASEDSDDTSIDRGRVARFAAWGPIDAAMTTIWYGVLDHLTEHFFPTDFETVDQLAAQSTNWSKVAFEVAVDQTVYCPIWFLAFFSFTGLWEKRPLNETANRIKTEMVPAVTTSWWVWIPVMTISFGFVHSELRVPYYLVASFAYAMLLSALWGDAGPEAGVGEEQETK